VGAPRRAHPRRVAHLGGGHENGYRSGTLNVPGIVGLGAACEVCRLEMADESRRLAALRERLLEGLRRGLDGVQVNGPSADRRLPHNLHVSFAGIEGERLLMALGDLAVSTGSACSSGSGRMSHVLEALSAAHMRAGEWHDAGARAFVAATVRGGQIFLPMHYDGVNALTFPSFDPHSRQPSYKHCAARVEKVPPR
jgi:hypothetical protein